MAFDDIPPPRPRWGRRLLLAGGILLLLIVAGNWLWNRSAQSRLDALLETYHQRGEPVWPHDLATPPVPDEQNAALDLRAAARLIKEDRTWNRFTNLSLQFPLTDRERQLASKVVEQNRKSLELVRTAQGKPRADWQLTLTSPLINVLMPDLNEQRSLANLVRARGMLAHESGDDSEAIACVADLLRLARSMDQQPMLISQLVGNGLGAMANQLVVDISPELRIGEDGRAATAAQVRALIHDLLNDEPWVRAQRRGLHGERVMQVDTVLCLMQGKTALGGAQAGVRAPLYRFIKPFGLNNAVTMARETDAVLAAVGAEDWSTFQARYQPTFDPQKQSMNTFLASMLTPAYRSYIQSHYRVMADRRLAATALALRLYELEHGTRAKRLEDLVPAYLPSVPADPFALNGEPLRYEPAEPRPVVYSIGPDGVDDGGAAYDMPEDATPRSGRPPDQTVHLKRPPRRPVEVEDELLVEEEQEADSPVNAPEKMER